MSVSRTASRPSICKPEEIEPRVGEKKGPREEPAVKNLKSEHGEKLGRLQKQHPLTKGINRVKKKNSGAVIQSTGKGQIKTSLQRGKRISPSRRAESGLRGGGEKPRPSERGTRLKRGKRGGEY